MDNGFMCSSNEFQYGLIKLDYPLLSPYFKRQFARLTVFDNVIRIGVVWKVCGIIEFPECQLLRKNEHGKTECIKFCLHDYIVRIIDKGNALMTF